MAAVHVLAHRRAPSVDQAIERHLGFVDGLRAIAVLAVVAFHAGIHSIPERHSPTMVLLFQGQHGVELFFVISGFCLAYPTLARMHAGQPFNLNILDYLAKRIVRIFPPFLIVLAGLVILSYAPFLHNALVSAKVSSASFSPLDVAKEAILFDRGPLHNASFWTLAIELRWYAVFPLALALFVRAPRALAALCVVGWLLYYQTTAAAADALALPAFFLGIFSADAFIRRPSWIRWAPYGFIAAIAAGFAFALFTRLPAWQLAAFALVLCAIWAQPLRAALAWPPVAFIGIASYSIYLVHEPVIAWAEAAGASAVLAGLIGILAGIAFWAAIERPLLRDPQRAAMVAWTRVRLQSIQTVLFARPLGP